MRRAAVAYTALGMLQRGLALLLLPFLARAMSVEQFGTASLLLVGNLLLVVVFGAGTDQAVLHATARESEDPSRRGVLRAARIWLLCVVPSGALVLAALVWFTNPSFLGVDGRLWAIEVAAAGLGAFAIAYAAPRLRVQRRIQAYAVLTGVTVVATVGSRILLVVGLHLGPTGWALSDLITACVTIFTAAAILGRRDLTEARATVRSLARFALPLLPSALSLWAMTSLNRPLAALVLSLEAVGLLSAAASAAGAAILLCVELNRALQPEYAREGFPAPMPNSAAAMRIQLWAGVVAAVLTCLLTPLFVQVVLPAPFASIMPTLAILSLSTVAWTLWAIANNITILTARNTRWSWLGTFSGAAVLAAGTLPLGSALGIEGVAIASVAAYGTMAAVALVTLRALRLDVSLPKGGLNITWAVPAGLALSLAVLPLVFRAHFPLWIAATGAAVLICIFQGLQLRHDRADPEGSRIACPNSKP
ncbi:polysaccharide biosynthesis protein [Mycolicibacterium aurum]|uniref:Polysaccharide biosynthesis protein n=1 Tax=Mycolicibacterium aurum TaxID=1791 RepID=A0A3S4VIQ7_MYCAU|nr:oligosaccharide flippase family protein [Mycolicibacterium aurum]VEG52322.1 polysaccharide biosynthesis protein [Mycolicibacterium aurum]